MASSTKAKMKAMF